MTSPDPMPVAATMRPGPASESTLAARFAIRREDSTWGNLVTFGRMSSDVRARRAHEEALEQPGIVARVAIAFTAWTEKWIPDAFIFALLATLIVVVAAMTWAGASLPQIVDAWGNGFWDLIPFTLQMALII